MDRTENRRVYRPGHLANTPATKTKPQHQGLLGVSLPTLWRWVRDGYLPKPYKLGPNTTVFCADEIDAFLEVRRTEGRP